MEGQGTASGPGRHADIEFRRLLAAGAVPGWDLHLIPAGRTPLNVLAGSLHRLSGSVRFYNLLEREGFAFVEEVVATPDGCLLELRNSGLKLIAAVRQVLADRGFGGAPVASGGSVVRGDPGWEPDGPAALGELPAEAAESPPSEGHDRLLRGFGPDACARLRGAHVGVIGCGGGASDVIQQLAYLGVGTLTIADADLVKVTNRPCPLSGQPAQASPDGSGPDRSAGLVPSPTRPTRSRTCVQGRHLRRCFGWASCTPMAAGRDH